MDKTQCLQAGSRSASEDISPFYEIGGFTGVRHRVYHELHEYSPFNIHINIILTRPIRLSFSTVK